MQAKSDHKPDLSKLPYQSYNYDSVYGACCENVVGYVIAMGGGSRDSILGC